MLTERRRKEIASLGRRKHRVRLGQALVEGVRAVEAAVAAGAPLVEVLVTEAAGQDPRVAALLARAGAPVHRLPERDLGRISDVQTSQGLVAVVETATCPGDRLMACRSILALDGLQDPGNVGTILRTAAWFGVAAVLAGPGTADFFNPKVVRAAMGGLWDLCLARTDDLPAALARFRAVGFACYGAALDGVDARTWAPRSPSVLVLGSEAHGLSTAVAAGLDACVTIAGAPDRRGAESLNVGVAAGILSFRWLGGCSTFGG